MLGKRNRFVVDTGYFGVTFTSALAITANADAAMQSQGELYCGRDLPSEEMLKQGPACLSLVGIQGGS